MFIMCRHLLETCFSGVHSYVFALGLKGDLRPSNSVGTVKTIETFEIRLNALCIIRWPLASGATGEMLGSCFGCLMLTFGTALQAVEPLRRRSIPARVKSQGLDPGFFFIA